MPHEVLMLTAEVNCSMLTQKPSTEPGAVWSHKPDNLVDSPQLPTNLTSFLKQPECATNEQCDALDLPTPLATCPTVRPRWSCQRGRMTSGAPQLPREPHPGLVPPHHWACNHEGLTHMMHIPNSWERLLKWMHNGRPRNRLWVSDFLQLNLTKYVGVIFLPASVTYIVIHSCCLEASGPPKTSKRYVRRELWSWPGFYRVMPSSPVGCIM